MYQLLHENGYLTALTIFLNQSIHIKINKLYTILTSMSLDSFRFVIDLEIHLVCT
jgi:hypothetical protein